MQHKKEVRWMLKTTEQCQISLVEWGWVRTLMEIWTYLQCKIIKWINSSSTTEAKGSNLCSSSSNSSNNTSDSLKMCHLMEQLNLIIKLSKDNFLHPQVWISTGIQCLLTRHLMGRLLHRDIIMDLQLLVCRGTCHSLTPTQASLLTQEDSMI